MFLFFIFFFLICAGSYSIGAVAFPQIIGSLRYRKIRPIGLTIFTTTLWLAILITLTVVAHRFLKDYLLAYYMGMIPTLLITLRTKNIE